MHDQLVAAIALSLYSYNVSPTTRAKKIHEHFRGACMDLEDLVQLMESKNVAFAMTELPLPTAKVYLQHALERYGEQAKRRIAVNESFEEME